MDGNDLLPGLILLGMSLFLLVLQVIPCSKKKGEKNGKF